MPDQPAQVVTPAVPSATPAAATPAVPVATPAAPAAAAAGPAATGPPATQAAPPGNGTSPLDIEQIASLVYERIGDKIEQRPDPPQDIPPMEQAVVLREKAPELYDLWLKIAQEKAATGNYVQRAPYEVPERLAQSGRPRALSAMIVVLAFCGYLAWLGGPGPYIGGLIAILDLLVMLGLFFGLRPDHLSDSPRPRKRRLVPATGQPSDWAPRAVYRPGCPARRNPVYALLACLPVHEACGLPSTGLASVPPYRAVSGTPYCPSAPKFLAV
jgi:hypothetical protein